MTVYAYGNGTHNGPYMQRDFDRSFPLILEALGLSREPSRSEELLNV